MKHTLQMKQKNELSSKLLNLTLAHVSAIALASALAITSTPALSEYQLVTT